MDLRKIFIGFIFIALGVFLSVSACETDDDDDEDSCAADDDDQQGDDDSQIDDDDGTDDDDSDDLIDGQNVTDSGCIHSPSTFYDDYTYDEDFVFEWDGAGTLQVYHGHVCYNCNFQVDPAYFVEAGKITIYERSQEGFQSVACTCLFEYTYDLLSIPPGDYEIEVIMQYRSLEEFPNGDEYLHLQETISLPDGQSSTETFSEYHDSGCG